MSSISPDQKRPRGQLDVITAMEVVENFSVIFDKDTPEHWAYFLIVMSILFDRF